MKISIKKKFKFETSHRLYKYEGKCSNIHGHNYEVWVHVRSRLNKKLDDLGMIIDFGDLKAGVGKWIDENWDHAIIYHKDDLEIKRMFENTLFKQYLMENNPTAENMAVFLLNLCENQIYPLSSNIQIFKIEVFENLESVAIVEL